MQWLKGEHGLLSHNRHLVLHPWAMGSVVNIMEKLDDTMLHYHFTLYILNLNSSTAPCPLLYLSSQCEVDPGNCLSCCHWYGLFSHHGTDYSAMAEANTRPVIYYVFNIMLDDLINFCGCLCLVLWSISAKICKHSVYVFFVLNPWIYRWISAREK